MKWNHRGLLVVLVLIALFAVHGCGVEEGAQKLLGGGYFDLEMTVLNDETGEWYTITQLVGVPLYKCKQARRVALDYIASNLEDRENWERYKGKMECKRYVGGGL